MIFALWFQKEIDPKWKLFSVRIQPESILVDALSSGQKMRILTIQDFARANGHSFDLLIGEATMALTLVETVALPVNAFPGQLRAPFSLMFRATGPVILPQRLYRLRHRLMGVLDLFLVPVGRDAQGVVYQAAFN